MAGLGGCATSPCAGEDRFHHRGLVRREGRYRIRLMGLKRQGAQEAVVLIPLPSRRGGHRIRVHQSADAGASSSELEHRHMGGPAGVLRTESAEHGAGLSGGRGIGGDRTCRRAVSDVRSTAGLPVSRLPLGADAGGELLDVGPGTQLDERAPRGSPYAVRTGPRYTREVCSPCQTGEAATFPAAFGRCEK